MCCIYTRYSKFHLIFLIEVGMIMDGYHKIHCCGIKTAYFLLESQRDKSNQADMVSFR